MTTKAEFDAQQWSVITSAPALAAMMVVAADSGGTLRETLEITRSYADARANTHEGLMGDLLASAPVIDRTLARRGPEELRKQALAQLREAIRLLEERATDGEVVAYKRFVFGVAEAVARAHKEGGFLGVGGTQVSEREQAALDEIAAIFDTVHARREAPAEPEAPVEPEASVEPDARAGFSADEARAAADEIGIDWDSAGFDVEQLRAGMDVELEHGRRDPRTNVTDDDPVLTAKIALAHLEQRADYYERLAEVLTSSE